MSKSIVITGASAGIGRATARAFLDAGWKVGLIGRRESELNETAQGHANALVFCGNVADEARIEEIFDSAIDAWGRVDALFNNAGVGLPTQTPDEMSVDAWRRVIEINLTGSFICARAAFARMRRQDPKGGRIINNGSVSAYVPRVGTAAYTASKHAITGLTRSLSLDGRPFDIACGQIDIGNALTEMAQKMTVGMPQPDGSVRPEAVMDVENVARSVLHMAQLPLDANVQFMTVMATKMPYIGRG